MPGQEIIQVKNPSCVLQALKLVWRSLQCHAHLSAMAVGHELSMARKHLLHLRLSRNAVLTINLCSAVAFMPHLKVQESLSASACTILLNSCWNILKVPQAERWTPGSAPPTAMSCCSSADSPPEDELVEELV